MTGDQLEQPVSRQGYPWYGWLLGIWFLIPLPLMFLGMSSPRARRHLNKWSIIGYSGLIYLVVIVVISIAASAAGSGEGMTNAASPSPTSRPTSTPVPTVDLCERSDVQVYFTQAAGIVTPLSDTFAQIGELSNQASVNPLLLVDSEWQFELGLNLGTLQFAADEIRTLQAPRGVQVVHGEMMKLADAMDEGATLYARGVDNLDVDLLELASKRFSEVSRLVESVNEKTLAMCP